MVIGREPAAAEVPVGKETSRAEVEHVGVASAGAGHAWYAIFDEAVRGVYTDWAAVCSTEPNVYRGFGSEEAAWEWLETEMLEEVEAAKPRTRRRARAKRFACYAVVDVPGWRVYATWEEVQKLRPQRHKGFHSVEVAEEWLGLHDVAEASASRPSKG